MRWSSRPLTQERAGGGRGSGLGRGQCGETVHKATTNGHKHTHRAQNAMRELKLGLLTGWALPTLLAVQTIAKVNFLLKKVSLLQIWENKEYGKLVCENICIYVVDHR